MECTAFFLDNYLKDDPPIKEVNGAGTALYLNVTVFGISYFDEMHMTYKARFSLNLKWFDWRVTFYNLEQLMVNYNYIGADDLAKLWLPRLIFSNSENENYLKFDALTSVIVQRIGSPKLNSPTNINEAEIYDGGSNPFVYNRSYEMTFECNFDLEKYPFDHQNCHINVSDTFLTVNLLA